MKRASIFIIAGVLTGVVCGIALTGGSFGIPAAAAEDPVRHIVLFKFKDDTSEADLKRIAEAGSILAGMDVVKHFEWGTELNDSARAQGFTHCLNILFANQADLETYAPHADHERYKAVVGPHVDKLLVFDFHPMDAPAAQAPASS